MAQSLDLVSADSVLKTLYKASRVEDATYRRHPTLAMIPKYEGFIGRDMAIPIQFGHPQGRSATFRKAQANTTAAKFEDFKIKRRKDYSVATVDGETVEATAGANNAGAFVEALAVQVNGALKSLGDSLSSAIFRNGTGSIGQVGSISTNSLVLKNPADVVHFETGMTLASSGTDGGTQRVGTEVIAKINRITGTLRSTSATWTTVTTALVANDYLFVDGDLNAKVQGFDAWCPATDPVDGALFNDVDRSQDSRLFGQRYDASLGDSMEESIINAQSIAGREGAGLDTFILNPVKYRDLLKGGQSRVTYPRTTGAAQNAQGDIARISFTGVVVEGDEGPIKVFSDPRCQSDIGWGLTLDTWSLNSIGPCAKILMKDGLRIQRQPMDDGYEVRTGMYGNMGNTAPGFNIRVQYVAGA